MNQSEAQRLQQVGAPHMHLTARTSGGVDWGGGREDVYDLIVGCAVQELEGKMEETNATAQEVRNILKTMESANKKEDKPGSSEARIRQNMQVFGFISWALGEVCDSLQVTLAKKFMDLMSECVGARGLKAAAAAAFVTLRRTIISRAAAAANGERRYTQMQEKTKSKYAQHFLRFIFVTSCKDTANAWSDSSRS